MIARNSGRIGMTPLLGVRPPLPGDRPAGRALDLGEVQGAVALELLAEAQGVGPTGASIEQRCECEPRLGADRELGFELAHLVDCASVQPPALP